MYGLIQDGKIVKKIDSIEEILELAIELGEDPEIEMLTENVWGIPDDYAENGVGYVIKNKAIETLQAEFVALIEKTGISKKKIAEFSGVTPNTVIRWANGRNAVPPLVMEKLRKLAGALEG